MKLLLIPPLLTQVIYSQCCSSISVTGSADLIYGNYKKLGVLDVLLGECTKGADVFFSWC